MDAGPIKQAAAIIQNESVFIDSSPLDDSPLDERPPSGKCRQTLSIFEHGAARLEY
jgi:hypothetical protein